MDSIQLKNSAQQKQQNEKITGGSVKYICNPDDNRYLEEILASLYSLQHYSQWPRDGNNLVNEWIKERWFIHTMARYSSFKRKVT